MIFTINYYFSKKLNNDCDAQNTEIKLCFTLKNK